VENREGFKNSMPPQMLDMGMPQEMSLDANEGPPVIEVSRPFKLGEGLEEIRSAEDITEENV